MLEIPSALAVLDMPSALAVPDIPSSALAVLDFPSAGGTATAFTERPESSAGLMHGRMYGWTIRRETRARPIAARVRPNAVQLRAAHGRVARRRPMQLPAACCCVVR